MPLMNDPSLVEGLKRVLTTSLAEFTPFIATSDETATGFDFTVARGDGDTLTGKVGYKAADPEWRNSSAELFFTVTLPNNATQTSLASEAEGGDLSELLQRLTERSDFVRQVISIWYKEAPHLDEPPRPPV